VPDRIKSLGKIKPNNYYESVAMRSVVVCSRAMHAEVVDPVGLKAY